MELFEVAVFTFLSAFIIYQSYFHRKELSRKEDIILDIIEKKDAFIKDLELKFMSRTPKEYSDVAAPPPKNSPEPDEEYLPVDDVDVETLIRAEDRLS